MKIFLLVTKSETVLNFRQNLIRHLLQKGYSVTVIAYDEEYHQEVESLGATFYCVPQENRWLNPFAILQYTARVSKILKQEKPKAVMTFQLKPNTFGVLAAKAAGVHRIYSMVEGAGDVFILNSLKWKLIRMVTCWLYRMAFCHVQRVVFLNEDDKQEFIKRQLATEEKCVLIPGVGVDLEHFSYCPIKYDRRFLMVARMLKTKGVEDYCKCARLVRQTYPDAEFFYLGAEGTVTLDDIREYLEDGSIRYLGTTRDVRPYLYDCTCILLPSLREGMPMAVMEAQAVGRCAIVTDAIGCKNAIQADETGFLVPVGDYHTMAEKCIFLIQNSEVAEAMGIAARRYAEANFDQEAINDYLEGKCAL